MRYLYLFCCLISCYILNAQSLSNETYSALNYLYSGYTEFAVKELVKSSNLNDVTAQYYLAVCYENGIVLEKNTSEAFNLYRRAAERGLVDAIYKLALCYKNGEMVQKNDAKSLEWQKRFERRGGKMTLPDLLAIYNEGLKSPENYALNPNSQGNSNYLASQDVNVGNNVNSTTNTTINITYTTPQPVEDKNPAPLELAQVEQSKSDVDINIPLVQVNNDNTFVVIFANENYRREAPVPFANNDGEVFKTYCLNVLGIPDKNIKFIADASLNDFKYNLNWLTQVMEAYTGEAKVIFYYSGHGIPDEAQNTAYLLPVDGYGSDVSTGLKVDDIYSTLGKFPSKSVTVFLDACFSGAKREGDMLASARGVAIKAKNNNPVGNMVVFSAAQGDETAYPYKEQKHGMFTYFLLKKLQETKGDANLEEISNYVINEVRKQSIVINGKMQTPTLSSSSAVGNNWQNWKLN